MREDILATKHEKLNLLKQAFGDAYPEKTSRSMTNAEALLRFEKLSQSQAAITLAGRVRSFRPMGKIAFAHIEDGSEKIQVFLSEKALGDKKLQLFIRTIELGDFI